MLSLFFGKTNFSFPTLDLGIDYDNLKATAKNVQTESMELLAHISELKKNTDKLDKIYSIVAECILQVDQYGKILDANTNTFALFGYKKEDLIGKNISILLESTTTKYKQIFDALNGKILSPIVIKGIGKSGRQVDLEVRVTSLNTNKGIKNYLVLVKDVTEELFQKRLIKQTESRYQRLAESIIDGIISHKNGIILDANKKVAEILGFDNPDDLIGLNLLDFAKPEEKEYYKKQLYSEKTECYNVNYVGKNNREGEIIPLEIRSNYLCEGIRIGTIRDLSNRTTTRPKIKSRKFYSSARKI